MVIVHSENSTAEPVWHPNPTVRGTWAIYQTCVITIFLCVWTTIHLNVPEPGEKPSVQIWRRVGWCVLTIIAPELVALNAWLQYRDAKELMRIVNSRRPLKESFSRHCMNRAAFACFAPVRCLDWLLARGFSISTMRDYAEEQESIQRTEAQIRQDNANLTWTMTMAFYASAGGCVYRHENGARQVLTRSGIAALASCDPQCLLPLQRAALQNPGKANGIAKAATCIQALWFCSQCVARLTQDLAVSLLELNTFAHCISALLIYMFWWDKPYEVESHIGLESAFIDLAHFVASHASEGRWRRCPTVFMTKDVASSGPHSRTQEASVPSVGEFSVYDQAGNRIFFGCRYSTTSESPSLISVDCDLVKTRGCIASIPGTGFYMKSHQEVSYGDLHMDWHEVAYWQKTWRKWVELGAPVPAVSIVHGYCDTWLGSRRSNVDENLAQLITKGEDGLVVPLVLAATFGAYGGLHLLAWQYNFSTDFENVLWKIASVMTATTGLILLGFIVGEKLEYRAGALDCAGCCLKLLGAFLALVNIVARAFLVVESFKALPNSPPSTYIIPNWAAYIPHI